MLLSILSTNSTFVVPGVISSQSSSSSSDPFFDDSFYDNVAEFDADDRIHDQIDRGFDSWEDR